MGRQQTLMYLRSRSGDLAANWNARFRRLAEIEADVAPFFQRDGKEKDSLEDDSVAQLSFQHELFKPLNHIPWLLFGVALFKIWIVPAMSISLPILMWILPYILLRFVYALPITQDQYMQVIQHMLSGNLGIPPNIGRPAAPEPWSAKTVVQYAMFAFTFGQSMIQPIQNAMHLYKTDAICTKLGGQILEIKTILQQFRADLGQMNGIHVKLSYSLEHFSEADSRMAFISIQDNPENIHMVFRDLAHLECMWRIAVSPLLQPITFVKDKFMLKDCKDISLNVDAVSSSINLSEQPHSILTGPNGGGKSSFLRAVLQSVLISHSFGFAPASEAYMPRFTWIASGLQLRDTPGTYSMFETEVKFAADCIHTAATMQGPGLVLFDELFHSTNPPDSERSAIQFLHRLWKKKEVFSVVSTHLFPLVGAAPTNVQAVCCHAKQLEDGEIEFSYALQPGICDVSSVHKVWERFGLARYRKKTRSIPEEQSLSATQNK